MGNRNSNETKKEYFNPIFLGKYSEFWENLRYMEALILSTVLKTQLL